MAQPLGPSFDAAVAGSDLAVAEVDLATGRVVAVSGPGLALLRGTEDQVVGRPVTTFVLDDPGVALPLLATGRLDGFEAQRRLRRLDGSEVDAYVWAHVLGPVRPARFAVVFVSTEGAEQVAPLTAGDPDLRVLGTVDRQWRVDRVSAEVEQLLGSRTDEAVGTPVLSAVHPNDVSGLLIGLAHVHESGRDAVVRVRVRDAAGSWVLCRARLASLDDPPKFAFTLRASGEEVDGDRPTQVDDIAAQLGRLAQEVRSAGLAGPATGLPTTAELPDLVRLTSREWEVLSALSAGARVPGIAAALALSPGTVRNHLSAVYRKLGVSSQAELLELLRTSAR